MATLYDDEATELARLKAHRTLVLAQIDRIILGGQSFGGGGIISVTQVSLADLRKDLADTESAIIAISVGTTASLRVWPDFGNHDADNESN